MYFFKVISLVYIKNTEFGDTRFHFFQDGASMAWVSNQTNLPSFLPSFYSQKHPVLRNENARKIPFVTKK
jgi:hypothetical protein